jgi:hypothetical protein
MENDVKPRNAGWLVTSVTMLACSTGEGEGWVRSDRLFVENCWNGPFDLSPTFFGANPYREEEILIRIQRGDNTEEVSDGLIVHVPDIATIRGESIGQPVAVGLPSGIAPIGVELPVVADGSEPVSLGLYLHATCHAQNGTVYALAGSITFQALFSGDPNEADGDDRLTEAEFDATFADPRDVATDGSVGAERSSRVQGYFRFYFQRGQPAQPFP